MKRLMQCMWLLIIALLINSSSLNTAALMLGNDKSPGQTTPFVVIREGESANITCRMNPLIFKGQNSNDLLFQNTTLKTVAVPRSDIFKVNNTAIIYMLRNARAQTSIFRCDCKTKAIAYTTVHVGWEPQPVQDFECFSYDFEYMVCNFTRPYNPVRVIYNMKYKINNVIQYTYDPKCIYEKNPIVCNLTRQFENTYNPSADFYNFELVANNSLGSLVQTFNIKHINVTIPAAPGQDFKVNSLTTNSISMSWSMPKYESYKYKGLDWELKLLANNSEIETEHKITNTIANTNAVIWSLNLQVQNTSEWARGPHRLEMILSNLPYAFYEYTLNLRVRVNNSRNWSETFVYKFQTLACRPDRPPRTNAGSFYIDSTETILHLFWEELEPFEHNGDHFQYNISDVRRNGQITTMKPLLMESNSAVFEYNKSLSYDFEIRSQNNVNYSLDASYIHVPAMLNPIKIKNSTPYSIHSVYHGKNRTYTLSWMRPAVESNAGGIVDNEPLLNYTVYWCLSNIPLSDNCKSSIHFEVVPATQNKFTTEPQSQEEYKLNMAVSANFENFNTGMHWAPCTSEVTVDLIRLKPEALSKNASVIDVQWSLDNLCPSILLGYNLTYCALEATANKVDVMKKIPCKSPPQTITISDRNAKRWFVNNLDPFTTYRIQMNMFSSSKVGIMSDAIYERTGEAAPTPPRDLQIIEIRNTSAIISWLPPKYINGIIKYYVVHVNDEERYLAANTEMQDNMRIKYELDNLMSFKFYKIYLTALTVASSAPSDSTNFTTHIGYPQVPENPNANSATNGIIIDWAKPLVTNGNLDFYEVEVTESRNNIIEYKRISIVNGTSCFLHIRPCDEDEFTTKVTVRAVNVVNTTTTASEDFNNDFNSMAAYYKGNDTLRCLGDIVSDQIAEEKYANNTKYRYYRSEWRHVNEYNCAGSSLSRNSMLGLFLILSSLGVMVGVYLARQKYYRMANIICKLPQGLDIYLTKDDAFSASPNDNDGRNANGYNNSASNENMIGAAINCNADGHNFHNEKHHLLASISNDSGYLDEAAAMALAEARCLDDGRGIVSQQKNNPSIPADYVRSQSESSSESLVGSNASTAEVEHCETDLQASYIRAENLSNGWYDGDSDMPQDYAQNKNEDGGNDQVEENEQPVEYKPMNLNNCSNYVAVESLNKPTAFSDSATHIQAPASIKPPRNIGNYSTKEQLAYMSGYVTQGELNAFGQQQQQQKQEQQQLQYQQQLQQQFQ